MDEQFKKLHAPKRTLEQQTQSLEQINGKLKKRKHFERLQVLGTSIASVALVVMIVLLFTIPTETVRNQAATAVSLQSAYHFQNASGEPVDEIDQWYYTGKTNVAKKDLAFLEQLAERTMQSTDYNELQWPQAYRDFVLHYEDGSTRYLQFWSTIVYDRIDQFVMDAATKQVYELSGNESADLQKIARGSSLLIVIIKFIGLVVVSYAALVVCVQFNLIGHTEQKSSMKTWKIIALMTAVYLYSTLVKGMSLYYFGAMNGLFIVCLLLLPIVLYHWRQLGKSTYQISTWALPIFALVIVYYVFVLI